MVPSSAPSAAARQLPASGLPSSSASPAPSLPSYSDASAPTSTTSSSASDSLSPILSSPPASPAPHRALHASHASMMLTGLFADGFFLPDDYGADPPADALPPPPAADPPDAPVDPLLHRSRKASLSGAWADMPGGPMSTSSGSSSTLSSSAHRKRKFSNLSPANHHWNDARHAGGPSPGGTLTSSHVLAGLRMRRPSVLAAVARERERARERDLAATMDPPTTASSSASTSSTATDGADTGPTFAMPDPKSFFASIFEDSEPDSDPDEHGNDHRGSPPTSPPPTQSASAASLLSWPASGPFSASGSATPPRPRAPDGPWTAAVHRMLADLPRIDPTSPLPPSLPPIILTLVEGVPVFLCVLSLPANSESSDSLDLDQARTLGSSALASPPLAPTSTGSAMAAAAANAWWLNRPPKEARHGRPKSPRLAGSTGNAGGSSPNMTASPAVFMLGPAAMTSGNGATAAVPPHPLVLPRSPHGPRPPSPSLMQSSSSPGRSRPPPPSSSISGHDMSRRKPVFLLRRADESQYVNATTLLLAGGVDSDKERNIVLSLERGRVRVRRPSLTAATAAGSGGDARTLDPPTLEGTWIPLARARALASTCSLDHHLALFLSDNLPSLFPFPLAAVAPTADVAGAAAAAEAAVSAAAAAAALAASAAQTNVARDPRSVVLHPAPPARVRKASSSTRSRAPVDDVAASGAGPKPGGHDVQAVQTMPRLGTSFPTHRPTAEPVVTSVIGNAPARLAQLHARAPPAPAAAPQPSALAREQLKKRAQGKRPKVIGVPQPQSFFSDAHSRLHPHATSAMAASAGATGAAGPKKGVMPVSPSGRKFPAGAFRVPTAAAARARLTSASVAASAGPVRTAAATATIAGSRVDADLTEDETEDEDEANGATATDEDESMDEDDGDSARARMPPGAVRRRAGTVVPTAPSAVAAAAPPRLALHPRIFQRFPAPLSPGDAGRRTAAISPKVRAADYFTDSDSDEFATTSDDDDDATASDASDVRSAPRPAVNVPLPRVALGRDEETDSTSSESGSDDLAAVPARRRSTTAVVPPPPPFKRKVAREQCGSRESSTSQTRAAREWKGATTRARKSAAVAAAAAAAAAASAAPSVAVNTPPAPPPSTNGTATANGVAGRPKRTRAATTRPAASDAPSTTTTTRASRSRTKATPANVVAAPVRAAAPAALAPPPPPAAPARGAAVAVAKAAAGRPARRTSVRPLPAHDSTASESDEPVRHGNGGGGFETETDDDNDDDVIGGSRALTNGRRILAQLDAEAATESESESD
ncbi:hypothetical protein AMAG_00584 [Allomyces macrogynus ATCC 38327]|uniref:HTH APSES-type domain-containing protein n=1 Tax=Allomyces macrogynus (strain ATCC 38327) TaxID=578462 RepID=A0A0L0RW48_ALLM3|nr:hypothetical protein AMAG_00584 [Allomyces macrogynus ATCC 38327]|eukprot:KNE54622.1 hypothetical protein AMAG_00584 [Allomyces macrogynus ATCC 38327]